jgi:hypothetical protein
MIVHLETSVQLALIASGATLLGQIANIIASSRRAHRAREERAALAQTVKVNNAVVTEKIQENTALTQQASANACQAYTEANSFNQKFAAIAEFESGVQKELVRLSKNIHAIANALTPLIGELLLEKRAGAGEQDKSS